MRRIDNGWLIAPELSKCCSPEVIEGRREGLEKKVDNDNSNLDQNALIMDAIDVKYTLLLSQTTFSGANIFNKLYNVYTDDNGKQHIPLEISGNNYQRFLFKSALEITERIISDVVVNSLIEEGEVERTERFKELKDRKIKGLQKIRDEIRRDFADEISYIFPVSKLINENPLREEDGAEKFSLFMTTRARRCLSDIINHYKSLNSEKKQRIGRTYKQSYHLNDNFSKKRPNLTNHGGDKINDDNFSTNPMHDSFQERYVKKDIGEFLKVQHRYKQGHRI